jgi:hypothetical protein
METKTALTRRIFTQWHYFSGITLAVFIGFHLVNQLFSLGGAGAHIELMNRFRRVYRFPPVEALLLAAVLSQLMTGMRLLFYRPRKTIAEKVQIYSGLYLSFFLLAHVSAVLFCRYQHLDSNFWLAAAGLNYRPATLFFLPYYFLAVTAVFSHVAAVHYRKTGARRVSWVIAGVGIAAAVLILAGFTNGLRWQEVPRDYLQLLLPYFGRH